MFGYPNKQLIPEYGRYLLVGIANVIVLFILYQLFVLLDPIPRYTLGVAFFISESIGSIMSHYLHRKITFKSSSPYGVSLAKTIIIYAVSIAIASILHYYVADVWLATDSNSKLLEYLSWYLNVALVGTLAFFALRFIAFPPSDDSLGKIEE